MPSASIAAAADEQDGDRARPSLGQQPPLSASRLAIQVVLEPLLVDALDAVDPDRAEHAEVFLEQAQVHAASRIGRVRRRRGRTVLGRATRRPARTGTRRNRVSGERQATGDHQQTDGQDRARGAEGRASAQQAVADVVDLAGEQVDDRADPLGRQRRLTEPVDLPVQLVAKVRGHAARLAGRSPAGRWSTRTQSQHQSARPAASRRARRPQVAAQRSRTVEPPAGPRLRRSVRRGRPG